MREYGIEIEPFQFVSYYSLECVMELNHHGWLKVSGLIEDKQVEEYEKLVEKETWVNVNLKEENRQQKVFFCGVLTNMEIKKHSGNSILYIELQTGSCLLDIEKHIRSFQDDAFLYGDVIRECIKHSDGKMILLDKQGVSTERFLLQYEESDWEFALRMAGYLETVLIPEAATPGKKFYLGYRKTESIEEIKSEHYKQINDLRNLEKKRAAGLKISQSQIQEYVVISREFWGLGETVNFQNKQMVIGKYVSRLDGSELYHEYSLILPQNGYIIPTDNRCIGGISLKAEVTKVEKARVQIKIKEDENQEGSGYRWFDYATVYSSPDGTGWYCMPEIGDEVRLTFSNNKEENAYVVSSVHLESAGGRTNPDFKSWKNRQNKEILFTPDSLILTNNQGLLLELSDQEGIKIISNKDINIISENDIDITSQNAGINVKANDSLSIAQGCAKIEMAGTINIGGGKIYMN